MKVGGVCSICSKASLTLNTCWRCGALVCEMCLDKRSGLCMKCAPKGRVGEWKK